jgi:hypothetical protein
MELVRRYAARQAAPAGVVDQGYQRLAPDSAALREAAQASSKSGSPY